MALDANGWTRLAPSASSRLIYVSSSIGSDSFDGLTESMPKKTIAAGLKLLRSGFPDWLYLKCGDTFPHIADLRIETQGGPGTEQMSGIGSYGVGPRPVILNSRMWYGTSTKPLTNFVLVDLDFYASFLDATSLDFGKGAAYFGIQILFNGAAANSSDNILIEGCRFRNHNSSVQINGRTDGTGFGLLPGMTLRRNVFSDAGEFGLQLVATNRARLEQNVFLRNGWDKRTVQLHNAYVTDAKNVIIRDNVFHKGGNMSLKLAGNSRSSVTDFTIEDNLFHRGMVGFGHSKLDGSWIPQVKFSHERGIVRNNVLMKPGKLFGQSAQAMGFNIGNLSDVLFESNIFAHNDEHLAGGEIFRFADPVVECSRRITARNNVVWNWMSQLYAKGKTYISFADSVAEFVQDNNLPTDVEYTDPSRTIAVDQEDAFFAECANMRRGSVMPAQTAKAFCDYMRAGFTVKTVVPPVTREQKLVSDLRALLLDYESGVG